MELKLRGSARFDWNSPTLQRFLWRSELAMLGVLTAPAHGLHAWMRACMAVVCRGMAAERAAVHAYWARCCRARRFRRLPAKRGEWRAIVLLISCCAHN
jgi:hypothetical protein